MVNQLTQQQCLAIYLNNIFVSLTESLQQIYPSIRKLVGDEFFAMLAQQYIKQYPSQSADLAEYGEFFAKFLSTKTNLASLSYLQEVAELEWAKHQVFYEQDTPVFDFANLAAISDYDQLYFNLTSYPLIYFSIPCITNLASLHR